MDHKFYKCSPDCDGCQFCLGGLALCVVCNKGENELAETCPGSKDARHQYEMNKDEREVLHKALASSVTKVTAEDE